MKHVPCQSPADRVAIIFGDDQPSVSIERTTAPAYDASCATLQSQPVLAAVAAMEPDGSNIGSPAALG